MDIVLSLWALGSVLTLAIVGMNLVVGGLS